MQAAMLRDAITSGAERYDLRGVSDSLDPDDPLVGLLRFKAGLGADAVELVGEWELALRPLRHRLVSAYLARR
ncbi:peptidoglycan bridge formation glycyltransferase FemA/FemB family protein [Nocardioides sp. TRM66260-LWL]|uniref:peptidoglycan bridge formation glycyltransferase FemA/FemB family protein n=1 Tax=Nocardioides sp. TRM66260-LWL TaxID=2874478 RepID=UPI0021E1652E|nr:peptidoglycan bridge formation glycyltransferase FemA/FemB family protein [Nocardioides sp. TRM66260-LWL]